MQNILQSVRNITPVRTALIAGLGYTLYLFIVLSQHNWDPSFFIMAGDSHVRRVQATSGVAILKDSPGYDGQFYFRMALDPFTSKIDDYGIPLDLPLHRQQRIVYPLMVWALSLGSPRAIPIIMVLVNLAGIVALTWLGARYAAAVGRRPVWGLVFPLFVGFLLALTRDLVEILTACWLLGGLLMAREKKHFAAGLFFTLGILTRETVLIVPFCYFLHEAAAAFREGIRARLKGLAAAAVPGAVYVAWQILLRFNWGFSTLLPNSGSVDMPFVNVLKRLSGSHMTPVDQILFYLTLAVTILTVAVVTVHWRRTAAFSWEKTSWILYFLLIMSVDAYIWSQFWNYLRAYTEWYVLTSALLLGVSIESRLNLAVWGSWAGIWLFVCQYLII